MSENTLPDLQGKSGSILDKMTLRISESFRVGAMQVCL